jgi:hypothetical protein
MAVTLRIKYFNTMVLRQEPILATTLTTSCSTALSTPAESNTIKVTAGDFGSDILSDVSYVISGPGVKDDTTGRLNNDKTVLTFDSSVKNKIEKGVRLTFSSLTPYALNTVSKNEWHIEESRIKGGFNESAMDYGPKAYAVDKKYNRKHRENSMIYSGIFNSRTGVNNTNQFSIAESITKSVDLAYGSIQKLYAEDTNLLIFQENKVNGALIDKDAIFTAEGSSLSTTARVVIGQITPYLGEYGIGKNPESFAVFGFRKYFVDKDRGAVLRLSRDGLTEISSYGMRSFFRKHLAITSDIRGFFDIHSRSYVLNLKLNSSVLQNKQTFKTPLKAKVLSASKGSVVTLSKGIANISRGQFIKGKKIKPFKSQVLGVTANTVTLSEPVLVSAGEVVTFESNSGFGVSLNQPLTRFKTLVFSDKVNGWNSFLTYNPEFGGSLNDSLYTFKNSDLYEHNDESQFKNTFYGEFQPSTITVVSNQNPSLVKHYKTVNYEGTNNWKVIEMFSPAEDNENYNAYPIPGNITGRYLQEGVVNFAGFTPLEKKYYANVVINDNSTITGISSLTTTGIKGFFTEATFEHQPVNNDKTINKNKKAELFSIGFNYEQSLY